MSGFMFAGIFLLMITIFSTLGLAIWSLFNLDGMTVILDFLNGLTDSLIYIFTVIYNILNAYSAGGFYFVWKTAFALISLWLGFQASRVMISGVRILINFILGFK